MKSAKLEGLRFGRWTVLYRAGRKSKTRRTIYWVCLCDCGNIRQVPTTNLTKGLSTQCHKCARKQAAKKRSKEAQGNRIKESHGYIQVKDWNHPNANKRGYVKEHTKVMSEHLGRPLLPGENVHHLNGVRDDNRIENLELWVSMQPSGQRPEDLVKWARLILERYDNG